MIPFSKVPAHKKFIIIADNNPDLYYIRVYPNLIWHNELQNAVDNMGFLCHVEENEQCDII